MTILEIIQLLIKEGHDISYYKRKDGGYRITRIDRERFRGSSGNIQARKLTGFKLSEARERSLKKLTTPKGKGSYNKRRKTPLDEETKKLIQKIQRQYRKSGKKEGKPTIRNYRWILKNKGKAEADRLLRQSERRILGLAYVENVEALLTRLFWDLAKKKDSNVEEIYELIKTLKYNMKDSVLVSLYEDLYDWERDLISGEEFLRRARQR